MDLSSIELTFLFETSLSIRIGHSWLEISINQHLRLRAGSQLITHSREVLSVSYRTKQGPHYHLIELLSGLWV